MKTHPALSDLLFPNQTRRKVLAWLLMHPDQSIHLRELARKTQAAPGTLEKEVDALCRVGLLHGRRIGNQGRVQAQVNSQHPVFAKLQALARKTFDLTDVLQHALAARLPRMKLAFVFGSIANCNVHAGSNVDVLVVVSVGFGEVVEALYPAQPALGREINPKVMTPAEWAQKRAEGSPFVQELLTQPRLMLHRAPDA